MPPIFLCDALALCLPGFCTGGIERLLANEIFGKIFKVSHFYLGFSLDENHDKLNILIAFYQNF